MSAILTADVDSIAIPVYLAEIAARLANEGIPVSAIARSLALPAEDIREALEMSLGQGVIVEIPPGDWPPTGKRADRLPLHNNNNNNKPTDTDTLLACQRAFKLTRLMAGFLVVLLKRDEVEKSTFHNVIENQRATRSTRPNDLETTDPKMVDVIICKLRERLRPFGLKIDTMWGHGYFMSMEMRMKAHEMLKSTPLGEEAPHDITAH
jgi:hypothetical protein